MSFCESEFGAAGSEDWIIEDEFERIIATSNGGSVYTGYAAEVQEREEFIFQSAARTED